MIMFPLSVSWAAGLHSVFPLCQYGIIVSVGHIHAFFHYANWSDLQYTYGHYSYYWLSKHINMEEIC